MNRLHARWLPHRRPLGPATTVNHTLAAKPLIAISSTSDPLEKKHGRRSAFYLPQTVFCAPLPTSPTQNPISLFPRESLCSVSFKHYNQQAAETAWSSSRTRAVTAKSRRCRPHRQRCLLLDRNPGRRKACHPSRIRAQKATAARRTGAQTMTSTRNGTRRAETTLGDPSCTMTWGRRRSRLSQPPSCQTRWTKRK